MSVIHNSDCRMPGRPGRKAEFFLEKFYSPDEIAIAFGVHKKTVLEWIKTDRGLNAAAVKPAEQIVRVPASALNDFIRRTRLVQEAA